MGGRSLQHTSSVATPPPHPAPFTRIRIYIIPPIPLLRSPLVKERNHGASFLPSTPRPPSEVKGGIKSCKMKQLHPSEEAKGSAATHDQTSRSLTVSPSRLPASLLSPLSSLPPALEQASEYQNASSPSSPAVASMGEKIGRGERCFVGGERCEARRPCVRSLVSFL